MVIVGDIRSRDSQRWNIEDKPDELLDNFLKAVRDDYRTEEKKEKILKHISIKK